MQRDAVDDRESASVIVAIRLLEIGSFQDWCARNLIASMRLSLRFSAFQTDPGPLAWDLSNRAAAWLPRYFCPAPRNFL